MPIIGMTEKSKLNFHEIGTIRKGGPKVNKTKPDGTSYQTVGLDLDHFRVVFDELEVETTLKFVAAYGDKPQSINILFPFSQIERVWDAWLECYTAGRLVARSDGEFIWYQIDTKTGETIVHNGRDKDGNQVKHPADNVGGYDYQNKPCLFKQTGRLKVIVPELQRLAYLTFLTSSKLDIINISSQLNGIEYMTGGNIAGVPLILSRRKKMISCPKAANSPERVRREKWMVSIEADPKWVKQELKQLSAAAYPQLAAGEVIESEYTEEEVDSPEDYGEEVVELEKRNSPSQAPHVENNPIDVHPVSEPMSEEIPEPEYVEPEVTEAEKPATQAPANDVQPDRKPLAPSVLKQYLASKAGKVNAGYEASTKQRWLAGEIMVSALGNKDAAQKVMAFLFGDISWSPDKGKITGAQVKAFLDYAGSTKNQGGKYEVSKLIEDELNIVWEFEPTPKLI